MKKLLFCSPPFIHSGKPALVTSSLVAMLALAGCGGGGGGSGGSDGGGNVGGGGNNPPVVSNPPPTEPTQPTQPTEPSQPAPRTPEPPAQALSCSQLTGFSISAASIGLPTTGAEIRSSEIVAPSGETTREYCRAVGVIRPATAGAPNIRFQVNMPTDWNRRILQVGNFGFGGSIVSGTASVPFAPFGATPLSRGYATFGSDTGHSGGELTFALNDEALANYGGNHVKKTFDAAVQVIQAFYASRPDKIYFAGGSTGGREALTAAQRWPNNYDGVIASAPTLNFTGLRMNGIRIGNANYASGGFLNEPKRNLVRQRAMAACDALDNVQDGIVSNVQACRARSETTLLSLRCADGTDQGDNCLSDQQINTIRTAHTDLVLPYQLADGVQRFEGYNVLEGGGLPLGADPVLQSPPSLQNGNLFSTGANWARFFVARDANFDGTSLNPEFPGAFQSRIVELSSLVGATNPDLSGFQAAGGKLILMHGLADSVASPNSTIDYYNRVVARLGQNQVDSFLRFYTIPGFNHESGVFNVSWDALGTMDAWATNGSVPGTLVGTDIDGTEAGRSRPLCLFPAYPRYVAGDVTAAESFACTQP